MMNDEVSLKDYFERVIAEIERRNQERTQSLELLIEARRQALALAVEKQEAAYNDRFEGVNEFRASLDDAVKRTVTREYVEARLNDMERRLNTTESRLANFDGRIIGYSAGIGIVVLIISIVSQFIRG